MKPELEKYRNMSVCVAVSGGKDSMALLHYLYIHGSEYGITLSALNCDHGIRGETSKADSAFVVKWCREHDIPVLSFAENCTELAKRRGLSVETAAREWRHLCYLKAGCTVATAHHMNDNAETVLFNLARGSALSGVTGIRDAVGREALPCAYAVNAEGEPCYREEGAPCIVTAEVIRPLISCTREEIDEYIAENGIPFVEDESNSTDDHTRNYIRHHVLPQLESAVSGAAKAIYRFSRLAAEIDGYIGAQVARMGILKYNGGALIEHCAEYVPFSRCAADAIKQIFHRKDYTTAHIDALYVLQFAETGKRYEFLGLTAYKEAGRIAICDKTDISPHEKPFGYGEGRFGGFTLNITLNETDLPSYLQSFDRDLFRRYGKDPVVLRFDGGKIPATAVLRTRREGDKFTKFGGGTKSLGDFLTDKKIPLRLRDTLPLIADGSNVLAVCGVEISDRIKVSQDTLNEGYIWCDALI